MRSPAIKHRPGFDHKLSKFHRDGRQGLPRDDDPDMPAFINGDYFKDGKLQVRLTQFVLTEDLIQAPEQTNWTPDTAAI
jgi:hypothetical protein